MSSQEVDDTRDEVGSVQVSLKVGGIVEESKTFDVLRVKNPIPGQYIVVFTRTTKDAEAITTNVLARNDVEFLYKYETAIRGFAATMPASLARKLAATPGVAFVEEDSVVTLGATQNNATWGLDRIDDTDLPLDGTYDYAYDGSGVHAYIVDTGIRASHNEFGGRVGNGYDFVSNDSNPDDCNGHGTHVAGTVGSATYGVAKNVTLHGVRVLSCSGSGSNSGVIAGVDWVASNHQSPAVANMSLGGGASTALDNAVNGAVNAGVTFAVAAGNDNTNACTQSPARAANAITVGSTTNTDARSSFSNYGSCVDIFAPGSSITSTWYTSNSATNTISGTSMASPHVAGVAALYLDENPSATPTQVADAIVSNGISGTLSNVGSGSPNLMLYSLFGGGSNPPPPPPPPPPPGAPCSGCEAYSGSLSGTGDWQAQPNGTYFQASSGTHQGWLEGPSGADFDLRLMRWNGFGWSIVATSQSASSSESITYNGSAGYYYWRIYSYSGSGSYDFWMFRP